MGKTVALSRQKGVPGANAVEFWTSLTQAQRSQLAYLSGSAEVSISHLIYGHRKCSAERAIVLANAMRQIKPRHASTKREWWSDTCANCKYVKR